MTHPLTFSLSQHTLMHLYQHINDQPSDEEINRVLAQVTPLTSTHAYYPSLSICDPPCLNSYILSLSHRALTQVIPLTSTHAYYPSLSICDPPCLNPYILSLSHRALMQVIAAVQTLYIAKKPSWETRPLVIL